MIRTHSVTDPSTLTTAKKTIEIFDVFLCVKSNVRIYCKVEKIVEVNNFTKKEKKYRRETHDRRKHTNVIWV